MTVIDRIQSARAGTNPTVIKRMQSGWAVLGDYQFLRGYSLLLSDPTALLGIYGTFNNVAPTSTLLNLSNVANGPNTGTAKAMLYCFTPVIGYSSFNSYTGNGNVDGPVVYLGFRPALIIIKGAAMSSNWLILDSKRDGYNVDNDSLFTNSANVEDATDLIDITSNGFKIRTTNTAINNGSSTYIYAAWAENPFSLARAR